MKIETNICDTVFVHDSILFPSIESQVHGFFAGRFTVMHEIVGNSIVLYLGTHSCPMEVTKKGVRLTVLPPQDGIHFGEGDYPSVKLPYNEDVTAKLNKFCDTLDKITDLEKRAKALPKVASAKKLEAFLKKELETERVTVSFFGENLFSGLEITFYIHPKGQAPADGVIVCLDKDNKIVPFWDASTERRKPPYGGPQEIENAVGCRDYGSDLTSMKKKIDAVEKLKTKIDAFDTSKSPEFSHLLEVKKQADALTREFCELSPPKKGKK